MDTLLTARNCPQIESATFDLKYPEVEYFCDITVITFAKGL